MPQTRWKVHFPPEPEPNPATTSPKLATSGPSPGQQKSDDDGLPLRAAHIPDDLDDAGFDENGPWPRRLVHVPSMTSHKWKPGNTYAGVANPKYSIISYTWGRWRIRDSHSLPTVKALQIKGVPWDVPRVDPAHFSAEMFGHILKLVCKMPPGEAADVAGDEPSSPSRFVWVDVGCIPQWRNSVVADSEIGRQARIFRGATYAFVWLTTGDLADIRTIQTKIHAGKSTNVLEDLQALGRLLDDPWFSSLWTLQESFLQDSAYVMASAGSVLSVEDLNRNGLMTLHGLRWFARSAVRVLQSRSHVEGLSPEFVAEFLVSLSRAGFTSPMSSPMETLACAQLRTSSFELDRVYGIMQIFGDEFRVGKARAAKTNSSSQSGTTTTPIHSFTLAELEGELGKLILEHKTLVSQVFRHNEAPLAGTAWRICGQATALSVELLAALRDKNNEEIARPRATLSTCLRDSITWATFKGKMCRFDEVLSCLTTLEVSSYVDVYLDAGPDHSLLTEDVKTLIQQFGSDSLMLLWISSVSPGDVHYALVLVKPGPEALAIHQTRRGWHANLDVTGLETWARIGVCQIYCEFERDADLLEVTSDIWVEQEEVQRWG